MYNSSAVAVIRVKLSKLNPFDGRNRFQCSGEKWKRLPGPFGCWTSGIFSSLNCCRVNIPSLTKQNKGMQGDFKAFC